MGRVTKLTEIIGAIKDKASQSKAALISNPISLSFHLALLRATTHDPFTPPNDKHLSILLSVGYRSRATASTAIEAIMDRLQSTRTSSVALKCLITVHHIIKYGSFILQDQLSVFPSTGGRNYLKLSDFRENSSPTTWELSSWVRWYAEYVENLLCTSRVLGFFLDSSSSAAKGDKHEETISGLMNTDLLKEIDSLVNLLDEISKRPVPLLLNGYKLVDEIMRLVGEDYMSATSEISIRIIEFRNRLSLMSFGESLELVCVLNRLEGCKERLLLMISDKKRTSVDGFWEMIRETKDMLGVSKLTRTTSRTLRMSESARFGDRLIASDGSLRFGSVRFEDMIGV